MERDRLVNDAGGHVEREPLSNVDLAWLRMDEPTNLMTITGLLFFEQPFDDERLKKLIRERLLPIRRFRQRVRRGPRGRAFWEVDADFDLEAHLFRVRLPDPGDEAALQAQVGATMSRPLDPNRPLWCFYQIENYQGGEVLLVRLHHCIADGIALMLVLLSLTDLAPEDAAAEPSNPLATLFRPGACDLDAAIARAHELMPEGMKLVVRPTTNPVPRARSRLVVKLTAALGRLLLLPRDPKTPLKGPLGRDKLAAWSEPIPIEDVKALRTALDATVNDILLTAMTGGLRRYLEGRSHPVHKLDFRAAVPVSLRRLDKLNVLGNEFGLVFLSLPVGLAHPRHRLHELKRRMTALKGSLEAGVVYGILRGMGLSPHRIQKLVERIFGTKATAVMTNVPGPRETLYLAGQSIRDILFWVPQSGRLGVGISICSYAGRVRLGVTTDAGLVPDPERIIEGFHRELEEMVRLAAGGG